MPHPELESRALALVITNFISQLRIPQSRQGIGSKKLPLARSKALSVSGPAIIPLIRHAARLIDPRGKHPLHVIFRAGERLSQVILQALIAGQRHQFAVFPHINSGDPTRLPIARFQQGTLRRIAQLLRGPGILIFLALVFLAFAGRIRNPLIGGRRRILRRLRRNNSHERKRQQKHANRNSQRSATSDSVKTIFQFSSPCHNVGKP